MSWRATAWVKRLSVHPDGTPLSAREKLLLFVLPTTTMMTGIAHGLDSQQLPRLPHISAPSPNLVVSLRDEGNVAD